MHPLVEFLQNNPVAVLIGFLSSIAGLILFGAWLANLLGRNKAVLPPGEKRYIPCARCRGKGTVAEMQVGSVYINARTCEVCGGKGVVVLQ